MNYFGTDGIRFIPDHDFDLNLIFKIGKAISCLDVKDIVIASDTRLSKDIILSLLSFGALSTGINIYYLGITSSPSLIYYSYKHNMVGVMVTASHNPYEYNGIKIVKKGYKLSEKEEILIERAIDDNKSIKIKEFGMFYDISNNQEYLEFLKKNIVKTDLKIAIDCAHGATYKIAPYIFNQVSENVIYDAIRPDGKNINQNVGSTHIDNLKNIVVENKCDIGFAFDGDGDRVIAVNKDGRIIDGDLIIYILSRYLKSKDKLNNNKVVLSIMSNLGIIHSLNKYGIEVLETPVGDKYVVQALKDNNLSLGGENSGHIIVHDLFHTGDGVLISLLLLKVLTETGTSISYWIDDIDMYYDKMVNIKVLDRNKVMQNNELINKIEFIKKQLNNDCKVIVRPSGTEELIRVSVMAKSKDDVEKYIDELVNIVRGI